jgi:hypothetical protein
MAKLPSLAKGVRYIPGKYSGIPLSQSDIAKSMARKGPDRSGTAEAFRKNWPHAAEHFSDDVVENDEDSKAKPERIKAALREIRERDAAAKRARLTGPRAKPAKPAEKTRACNACGREYVAIRSTSRFCGDTCKKRAQRAKAVLDEAEGRLSR